MGDTIIIELAGEPRGKGRPRFSRASGRAFTPAATRSYESALRYAAQVAMGQRSPIEGPVEIDIIARFPVPQSWPKSKRAAALLGISKPTVKPDIDNLAKVVDALNNVVFIDDKQIITATISKRYHERPSLVIEVREAPA